MQFSDRDLVYIETDFICLSERPASGPGPSYVLQDGSEYYPPDIFEHRWDEREFKTRFRVEMQAQGSTTLDPDEAWKAYLTGIYGVCLRSATPENIVRKNVLVERIERLLSEPREYDGTWIAHLSEAVNALDGLERPFSPDYDRVRFGRPPTRDSHIADVRRRFPRIVDGAA